MKKLLMTLLLIPCLSKAFEEKNERHFSDDLPWNTISYINTDTKGNKAFVSINQTKDGTIINKFISKDNYEWRSFDGHSQQEISENIPLIMWAWLEKRYKETHPDVK